ncbi:hypothetical protein ACHAWF_019037 [Thalassiosira exigua]
MKYHAITSPERFLGVKKSMVLVFAGALVSAGYLIGRMENDIAAHSPLAALIESTMGARDRDVSVATTSEDKWYSSPDWTPKRIPHVKMEQPEIRRLTGMATSIDLIGERHSGTNWITDHLRDCFGDQIPVRTSFTRFKHWFQLNETQNRSAVVIAMFRDPYDWVMAMRERPHHAHDHIGLEWKAFVTKPWIGQRPKRATNEKESRCMSGYSPEELVPCRREDSYVRNGHGNNMYELDHFKSGRAYGSIIELRTAKILNFLQVSEYHGVRAFLPERYEQLSLRGTASLLKQVEGITGLKARCEPYKGSGLVRHKDLDPKYVEWMNRYHAWDVEAMIGYFPRDVPCSDSCK